jgi:lauroyl/myristoyl acyltransferase
MKLGVKFSFKMQVAIGKIIGRVLYWLPNKFKKIAFINIAKCFPDKSSIEVCHLTKKNFD